MWKLLIHFIIYKFFKFIRINYNLFLFYYLIKIVVLVEIGGNIKTFICSVCKKIIAKDESFFIDPKRNPKFKYHQNFNNFFNQCSCEIIYNLIKDHCPEDTIGLKFKECFIIETEPDDINY